MQSKAQTWLLYWQDVNDELKFCCHARSVFMLPSYFVRRVWSCWLYCNLWRALCLSSCLVTNGGHLPVPIMVITIRPGQPDIKTVRHRWDCCVPRSFVLHINQRCQIRTWLCLVMASLGVTVPGSAARFRTIADPDHVSSYPLFLSSAILNPLDVWRLHQEANWAFIKSDFWEIAPRQGPGCEIIFNDVHLITLEVFLSSPAACNSRHVWTRDRQSN